MEKGRSLPFAVNRNDARPLVDQVADGLRMAIVGGFYCPGDEIPSSRELVPLLGVSRIVTSAAISRLAKEGLVLTRHGLRPVVRDHGAKQWLGHVVFVYNSTNIGYFQTAMAETLRSRLNDAGYLFTRTAVTFDDATGTADFSPIDAALAHSVNLVLAMTSWHELPGHLARLGIPYAFVSQNKPRPHGVGETRFDKEGALRDLAEACKADGIRKVVTIKCFRLISRAARQFRAVGIEVTESLFGPVSRNGTFTDIEHTGLNGFRRLIESGRVDRDTLYYFEDDYLARGALMAMTLAGLRAPDDIRVATLANAGFLPAYDRDLTRIEIDPVEAGIAAAADVLAFLRTGHYPEGNVAAYKFIRGETMRNVE